MRLLLAALVDVALADAPAVSETAPTASTPPADSVAAPTVGPDGALGGAAPEVAAPPPVATRPPPYQHCLARFGEELDERRLAAESQLVGGALGTGSAAASGYVVAEAEGDVKVALLLLASMVSPSTTTLAASPVYIGLGVADVLRLEDRRRVFRALQEAQVGDGLVLRDLAIEVGLRGADAHPEDLARLLRYAPEPCRGELMTWDELVTWTSSGVLALPPQR